jgi:hypothetical protein
MGGSISRGDNDLFNENENTLQTPTNPHATTNTAITQQIPAPQPMPTSIPHDRVMLQPQTPQQNTQLPQTQPQMPQQVPPQQNIAPPRPQLRPNDHVVHRNLLDAAVKGITEHVQLCINAGGNIHVCDQVRTITS